MPCFTEAENVYQTIEMKVGYLFNLSFVSTRFYGEFGVEIVGNNIILGLSICPLLNLLVSESSKLNEFRN